MKDNDTIYHLTESLIELVYFLITSIFLKSCDKMWLALDRAHHMKLVFKKRSVSREFVISWVRYIEVKLY